MGVFGRAFEGLAVRLRRSGSPRRAGGSIIILLRSTRTTIGSVDEFARKVGRGR